MMLKTLVLLCCCCLINAQVLVTPGVKYDDHHHHHHHHHDDLSQPTPYQFTYSAPAEGGGSTHQESGDGSGRVTGSYTVEDDDGRSRVVEYVADEGGFRAAISTNEPGTANQNPADVAIESSADDGYGGVQTIAAAPSPVISPVAVVPRAPVRIASRPTALRIRRPALVPIQPALVPLQPTILPSGFNRYITRPAFLPFDDSRLISPASYPFATRLINQPALIPVAPQLINQPAVVSVAPRLISQPAVVPVGARLINQPSLIPISGSLDSFRSGFFGGYRSFNDKLY